jgi:biopolymer transport protein ExbB
VFNWNEIWQHMSGPALVVAGLLILMGLASLTVFVERLLTLRRSRRISRRFAARAGDGIIPSTVAQVIAEARAHGSGPLARLVDTGLSTYQAALSGEGSDGLTPVERTRRRLERRIDLLVAEMKRGLPVLASVGSIAPFVGLLGTVLGIISAFQGIAATGSGGLSSVSAGIAEALVLTALGLAVAIPSVLAFNYLATRISHDQLALTDAAGELVDRIEGWGERQIPVSAA